MVRMQAVQATMRCGTLPTIIVVFWMFGRQGRFVFRLEWLTLWPKVTPLPHSSQRLRTLAPRASPRDAPTLGIDRWEW